MMRNLPTMGLSIALTLVVSSCQSDQSSDKPATQAPRAGRRAPKPEPRDSGVDAAPADVGSEPMDATPAAGAKSDAPHGSAGTGAAGQGVRPTAGHGGAAPDGSAGAREDDDAGISKSDAGMSKGTEMRLSPEEVLHQSCQPSSETNPCWRCEAEHCCETRAFYDANAEAKAFRNCVIACQDEPVPGRNCYVYCDQMHPTGTSDFALHVACVDQFCPQPSECGEKKLGKCQTCMIEYCAAQNIALDGTRSGLLSMGCNGLCPDNDGPCGSECFDTYPEIKPALDELSICLVAHCSICEDPI